MFDHGLNWSTDSRVIALYSVKNAVYQSSCEHSESSDNQNCTVCLRLHGLGHFGTLQKSNCPVLSEKCCLSACEHSGDIVRAVITQLAQYVNSIGLICPRSQKMKI